MSLLDKIRNMWDTSTNEQLRKAMEQFDPTGSYGSDQLAQIRSGMHSSGQMTISNGTSVSSWPPTPSQVGAGWPYSPNYPASLSPDETSELEKMEQDHANLKKETAT